MSSELGIDIATSIFFALALSAFWKRALHKHISYRLYGNRDRIHTSWHHFIIIAG